MEAENNPITPATEFISHPEHQETKQSFNKINS
jgi:hypothetical protein